MPPSYHDLETQLSTRLFARSITLLRSPFNAFLLSLSRSAGITGNANNVAMSLASAILTFINCSSLSILSNVRFDKSFSGGVNANDCKPQSLQTQRRGWHIIQLQNVLAGTGNSDAIVAQIVTTPLGDHLHNPRIHTQRNVVVCRTPEPGSTSHHANAIVCDQALIPGLWCFSGTLNVRYR